MFRKQIVVVQNTGGNVIYGQRILTNTTSCGPPNMQTTLVTLPIIHVLAITVPYRRVSLQTKKMQLVPATAFEVLKSFLTGIGI